jgi:hypothetical protein
MKLPMIKKAEKASARMNEKNIPHHQSANLDLDSVREN